jgi:rubrerythrin
MSLFDAKKIITTAITMEINGEKFYSELARRMKDAKMKKVFLFLAGEEVKHRKIFEQFLFDLPDTEKPRTFYNEYFAYLRSYVDSNIFSFPKLKEKIVAVKDLVSAVNFAIQRELESIGYYQEMKAWVPVRDHAAIQSIIEEERRHFIRLIEIKRRIK